MDFQTAQAIAYRYTRVFAYAATQSVDAQNAANMAGRAARRYLWAAIERKTQERNSAAIFDSMSPNYRKRFYGRE